MQAQPTEPAATPHTDPLGLWRWLPFSVAALGSIGAAFFAPDGRKAFSVDWHVSLGALAFSLNKGPHIGASALLALVAVLATGRDRPLRAALLTLLVGACWELGQTTVVGHQARLSDLLPDAIGALLGCAWGVSVMWLLAAERRNTSMRRQTTF